MSTQYLGKLIRLLAGLGLCIAIAPVAASASFPGKNGRLVLALDGCNYERHLVSLPWRGGAMRPVTPSCPQPGLHVDVTAPDASPDGRMIIAFQEQYSDSSDQINRAFTTMATDGRDRRTVEMPVGTEGPSAPSFAPNGERFAFHGGNAVWSAMTDGSDAEPIRSESPCLGLSCTSLSNPRWSPDGELIAVTIKYYAGDLGGAPPIEPGIWLMRADDGSLVRRIAGERGDWVDWSPDGEHLVFGTAYRQASEAGGTSGGNLYVVDRNGSNRRTLVHRENSAETEPTWSPNGRWISFLSLRFGGGDVSYRTHMSLWRIRAAGGKLERVQGLPAPKVEEGEFNPPGLTWLPKRD